MGNERDAKPIRHDIDNRETNAINRYRSFGNHLGGQVGRTGKPYQFPVALSNALGNPPKAVDVALHEVSTKPIRHSHRALEIHSITRFQLTEIRALKGFRPGLEVQIV